MAAWTDGYWESRDGLRLHYRDYPGPADKPPILCIPGLTRNARDFEPVAERLAGAWRLIVVELRGRGESGYARDPMTYVPRTYSEDVQALVQELGLSRVVAFGTSLGALVTMLLSSASPQLIAGALLNDIGPAIEAQGVTRISGYVGRAQSHATWLHAARALAEAQGDVYPNYDLEHWLGYAKRLYKLTPAGRVVLDYDMKIAEPFRVTGGETGFDMWAAFESLRGKPVLLVRGGRSDLISAATAEEMARRVPTLEVATVPDVGHAPVLDEPEAADAIDKLLARVGAG
jgi:pimeloyl-ACP methyl ester carboxylesterase